MDKIIWIVNYYTGAPDRIYNPRYLELARYFMDAGYKVITFNATTACKNTDELEKSRKWCVVKQYGDYIYVHVKVPHYVGNGLKRMWSIFVFALKMFVHRHSFPRPDVVLHNIHTPFDYPILWMARGLKTKYIAEAWDMWPENFVTFGLVKASNPAMKFFYWLERRLYQKADRIVFTFEGGADYIRQKGWDRENGGKIDLGKVHYINNGVNIDAFDANCKAHPRPDEDMNNPDFYKIVYLGSIFRVNNVKTLIDSASLLSDNPKYRFFIYGDGSERPMLEQYARDNHIDNVVFKEKRIPLEECAWVVSQATVNVMNYQKNFGIHGVSSGKMFQYFAAGKPVCCNISLNYSEISRRNLGVDRDLDTPEQYAEAMRSLAEQSPEDYAAMCARVRKAGEDFDYKVLAARELEVIEGLL